MHVADVYRRKKFLASMHIHKYDLGLRCSLSSCTSCFARYLICPPGTSNTTGPGGSSSTTPLARVLARGGSESCLESDAGSSEAVCGEVVGSPTLDAGVIATGAAASDASLGARQTVGHIVGVGRSTVFLVGCFVFSWFVDVSGWWCARPAATIERVFRVLGVSEVESLYASAATPRKNSTDFAKLSRT